MWGFQWFLLQSEGKTSVDTSKIKIGLSPLSYRMSEFKKHIVNISIPVTYLRIEVLEYEQEE